MDVLPEFRLVAEPMDEAARQSLGFQWATPEVGRRHKIGGMPDFLHENNCPNCPSCDEVMQFWAQIDSVDDKHCIADVGRIYVFPCSGYYEARAIVQSG